MSQSDFGTINPNTKSGTVLASDLGNWRDALYSGHSGTTRPTYAADGLFWRDTSGTDPFIYYYNGSGDAPFVEYDVSDGVFRFGFSGNEDTYWKPGSTTGMFLFSNSVEVMDATESRVDFYTGLLYLDEANSSVVINGTTALPVPLTVHAGSNGNMGHIAPGVASGETTAHEMRFRWTNAWDEYYLFPVVDGTTEFNDRFFHDFTRGEWGFGTPLILRVGTAPTSSPTDGIVMYAEGASAELKVRDEAGNITTLSPHNFTLIPDGPSEPLAWSYFSEEWSQDDMGNPVKIGAVNIDMMRLARTVERLTGEKHVFIEMEAA